MEIAHPPSPHPGASPHRDGRRSRTPKHSPLYQQIKALIVEHLSQGEWRAGQIIPSELELAARYGVSQGTVRKAIDELAAEHLLVRRQGRGTFVATHTERQTRYRFLRLRSQTTPQAVQESTQRDFIACRNEPADARVAAALAVPPDAPVLYARRLLRFGGAPAILEDLWLPTERFDGLTAQRLANYDGPMYALYEAEFAVHMVRAEEKLRAVLPGATEAQLLDISPETPVLSVERVACSYDDTPMELRLGLYRTDTYYYHSALN